MAPRRPLPPVPDAITERRREPATEPRAERAPRADGPGASGVVRLTPPVTGPSLRTLRHLGVWSVFKLSLGLYVALFVLTLVAGIALWVVFSVAGVIGNIEGFFGELLGYNDFRFLGWRILQFTVLVGLLWVVLAAALTAVATVVFNRVSRLTGGIELTVAEEGSA